MRRDLLHIKNNQIISNIVIRTIELNIIFDHINKL